jgi:hypothetical protein
VARLVVRRLVALLVPVLTTVVAVVVAVQPKKSLVTVATVATVLSSLPTPWLDKALMST